MNCGNRDQAAAAYLGFAVFGGFWGAWGASIPAIRDQAEISDGQLGTALLFVGAGALPAMPVAGRLVDQWGTRVAAVLLAALGLAGILVAATAQDMVSLSVGLAVLGAVSGAADVAINAVAGSAQAATGAPVVGRAHAIFSASVVVASLGTGAARAAAMPLVVAFAVLAVGAAAAAIVLARHASDPAVAVHRATGRRTPRLRGGFARPLLVLGGLGALAFAVENGHQSWSALYLSDVLDAGPAAAAAGPAVFAAVVALTRWSTAALSTRRPGAVLFGGSLLAAAGTTALAVAPSVGPGLLALAAAAAGTAVLFPTLLSVLTSRVPQDVRGAATSVVATTAYLGFLAGPVYVGRWAAAVDLPGAMLALAALAAALAVLAPISVHRLTNASAAGATGAPASADHSSSAHAVDGVMWPQMRVGQDGSVIDATNLSTARLLLPPLTRDHTEQLAAVYRDPEVARYVGGTRLTDEVIPLQVANFAGEWGTRGYGQSAVILRESGAFVGRIGLHYWPEWNEIELGYVLTRSAQGVGLAAEGAQAWLDWAKKSGEIDHLIANIHPENEASIRFAERLDFTFARKDVTPSGMPTLIYRLDF